jgi:DNA replication protein DnaC
MNKELSEILDRVTSKVQLEPDPTPEERERRAREAEERAWLSVAPKIGVPRRLSGASFEGGLPSPMLVRVRQYVEGRELEDGQCLMLAGPTGVGKTYASVSALRAYRRGGRFFYFPGLCGALLHANRSGDALEAVKRVPFVVLDDFGTEYVREGGLVETLLDEIIWHRESEILPTIITTNLTGAQLKDRLSDRIVDRLRGWGHVFTASGGSLRAVDELPLVTDSVAAVAS